MDKREKVIKAFEFCLMLPSREELDNDICSHDDCPYYREYDGGKCVSAVARDSLALLKAQEPRVFGVGDFYGEEFGYLEYNEGILGFSNFEPNPVLISNVDEENVTVIFRSSSVLKLPLDRMNINWRIWSDYPTHELLKVVKWDG